jgi:sulfur carrier protein
MRISVNGNPQELEAQATVADLVANFNLQPKFVAVEVNCELVPRRNFDQTRLREGDQVEIVTLVGGG